MDKFQLLFTLDFRLPPIYSDAGNALRGLLLVAIETPACLSSDHTPFLSLPSGLHHFLGLGRVHFNINLKRYGVENYLQSLHLDLFSEYAVTLYRSSPRGAMQAT